MSALMLYSGLLLNFAVICNGRGVNLRLCDKDIFHCKCGSSDVQVRIEASRCTYFRGLKTKCKPCNNEMTPERLCPKLKNCAHCYDENGDNGCAKCPIGKFGKWCENVCLCQNDGHCDTNGICTCPNGFEGQKCETRKGCLPPPFITLPLKTVMNPPDFPLTIVYSCESGYHLKGVAISSCLPNGQWTNSPPQCLAKCPLLSAPANGQLNFGSSDLTEGVTAEFSCNADYRLIGEKTLKCLADGRWNSDVPHCEKLVYCPDPGFVKYARRISPEETPRNQNIFHQDSTLRFDCKEGFQQTGTNTIKCLHDGTWSTEKPRCLKASTIVPNCSTTGSEIVAAVSVPVRVLCPPECSNTEHKLWGTSIYRIDSAICPAAIHAGKLTNSGGLVAVINNGEYTSFAGSYINNIRSESYEDDDQSFRFDKLPSLAQIGDDSDECPEGLIKLDQTCALISTYPSPKDEAEAICTNFGLTTLWPKSPEDQKKLLQLLENKGVDQLWTDTISELESTTIVEGNETINADNSSEAEIFQATPSLKCGTMEVSNLEFVPKFEDCNLSLHYVCTYTPFSKLFESCSDPGPLEDGNAKHVGKINNAFYVGSSIEYSCKSLHYLKGTTTIFCRGNGTWSDEKPACIKVDTCEEPPIPFGGFVNYLPPLDSPMAERIAISRSGNPGIRMARLPVGLNAKPAPDFLPTTTTPGPEALIDLPEGHHRIGTRAMYDCESRYYRLVGSRTRRCQARGQWSGRSPTCIPVCGRSDSPRTPFIVNGNASDIGQWPWQAGLARYIPDYDRWFLLCGGSLLSERWIITAAHCVTYAGTTLTIDPDKFRVYLGKYHRTDSKDDEYVQTKTIHEIHTHPDYDPGTFDADIALIQLESPVQLNSRVQPVCLPTEQTTKQNLTPGTKAVVTGWGMNENNSYSDTLQQAVLPVISNEECEKGYAESDLPLTVTENMFCAGFKEGRYDACSGDSGGPIVFADDSEKTRRWVLEGIVSWGSPRGCGNADQYGGYTTVSRFLDWIHLFV